MTGKQYFRILVIVLGVAFAFLALKAFIGSGQEIDFSELLSAFANNPNQESHGENQNGEELPFGGSNIYAQPSLENHQQVPTATLTKTPGYTPDPTAESTATISCKDGIYRAALRRSPGYINKDDNLDVLVEIPCGETVVLLGERESADGLVWWNVEWRGTVGWVAERTGSGKTILIFD